MGSHVVGRRAAEVELRCGEAARIDDTLDDLIFDRDVERLVNQLGARPVAEILREVGARCVSRTLIHNRVREYLAKLDRRTLKATGGDRFAGRPIHLVRS